MRDSIHFYCRLQAYDIFFVVRLVFTKVLEKRMSALRAYLNMEEVYICRTLLPTCCYTTALCHDIDDHNISLLCRQNLKPYVESDSLFMS